MSHIFHPVSGTSATMHVNSNLAQEIYDTSMQKYNGNLPDGCIAARIKEARDTKRSELMLPIDTLRELQALDMFLHNGREARKGLATRTFGQSYGMKVGHI